MGEQAWADPELFDGGIRGFAFGHPLVDPSYEGFVAAFALGFHVVVYLLLMTDGIGGWR